MFYAFSLFCISIFTINATSLNSIEVLISDKKQKCATLPSFMNSQARVVNGFIAPKPIPWIVSLWSPDKPKHQTFCTGTILDEVTILTAAHCIIEHPIKKGTFLRMMVMAGSTKVQEGINILVERFIFANEMWESSKNSKKIRPSKLKADMAILKLSRPLPFDETIMPLCLPTKPFSYKRGLECFIAGWGNISPLGEATKVLRWGKTRILEETDGKITVSPSNMGPATNICPGDSGSSLVCMEDSMPIAAGVLSYGPKGCGSYPNLMAVFFKTEPFLPWIRQTMESSREFSNEPIDSKFSKCDNELPDFMKVPSNARISFGQVAYYPIPWHVAIGYGSGMRFNYLCGGTIIDKRTVISARSCFNESLAEYLTILAGTSFVNSPIAQYPVESVKFYGYLPYRYHSYRDNIIIYKLKYDLPLNKHIRKICLPPKDIDMSKVKNCWISGWGEVKHSIMPLPNATNYQPTILQWAKVNLWNHEECQAMHSSTSLSPLQLTDKLLCAGSQNSNLQNQDYCEGDQGGSLVCSYDSFDDNLMLVGIITEFVNCGKHLPGLYTNVLAYSDWISSQMIPFVT